MDAGVKNVGASAVQAILTARDGAATVRALVAGGQDFPEAGQVVRHFWAAGWPRSGRSSSALSPAGSSHQEQARPT
jgi:hypothetical protein